MASKVYSTISVEFLSGVQIFQTETTLTMTPNDFQLRHWSLAPEDVDYKIPVIEKAKRYVEQRGDHLKLFSTPWSPPIWMKDNNNITRGHLRDEDRIYSSYAEYLMKFYDAYEEKNISFWGATVQNEPYASNSESYFFNSLQFDADQMIKFVAKYLGPALEAKGKTKENFKLMVGDDNLGMIDKPVKRLLDNPDVARYVAGLAFHWYSSGQDQSYDRLSDVYDQIRDNIDFVLMSEACEGFRKSDNHVSFGNWTRAETYASDIIEDFKRMTSGWIDWNLALNMEGGPSWVSNFVDSPILVNAKKGEFYKQPMYYALAHFSRIFRPGAIVVEANLLVEGSEVRDLDSFSALAAKDERSGHILITILNKSEKARDVEISINGVLPLNARFGPKLEPHSITSVIVKI